MFNSSREDNMLCYELEPGEEIDELTVNMLQAENPRQILVLGQEDGRILFPVSSCRKASDAIRDGEPVARILLSLFQAVKEARQCMIPVSELLLSAQYVYINKESGEVCLLCLPTDRASRYSQNQRDLFLTLAAYAASEDCSRQREVWDLLCYLNSDEYSLSGLVEWLNRPKKEPEEKPEPRMREKLQSFLAGDTQELPEIQAYSGPDDAYSLVLRSTGQEFPLGKRTAVIGSDPASADICLRCNVFVDAQHAKILWERGAYYVEDLHSHAGIRRNSRKVKLWRPERLEPGDVLKIGDDELVFSCRNMPK